PEPVSYHGDRKVRTLLKLLCSKKREMKTIELPSEFNAATHFIARHVREGRDQQVTYAQLLERVNRFGNVLKKLGVRQEERVALLLLDTPEFFYGFFG